MSLAVQQKSYVVSLEGNKMTKFGLYFLTPVIAFSGGFFSYLMTLKIVWGQSISRGDILAVLLWSGIAFFAIAIPIYFVIIYFVDRHFVRFKLFLYPTACALIFFTPTFAIIWAFGSSNLFSPESMLFNSFFISSGVLFGLGNWVFKRMNHPTIN